MDCPIRRDQIWPRRTVPKTRIRNLESEAVNQQEFYDEVWQRRMARRKSFNDKMHEVEMHHDHQQHQQKQDWFIHYINKKNTMNECWSKGNEKTQNNSKSNMNLSDVSITFNSMKPKSAKMITKKQLLQLKKYKLPILF